MQLFALLYSLTLIIQCVICWFTNVFWNENNTYLRGSSLLSSHFYSKSKLYCSCKLTKKITESEQLFSTLVIIRNVSWAENQHIRMISEGSWDTKTGVWLMKINLHQRVKSFFYNITIEAVILNCNNISQYLTYLTFLFTIPYTMPESYQVFSISLTWWLFISLQYIS